MFKNSYKSIFDQINPSNDYNDLYNAGISVMLKIVITIDIL